MRSGLVDGRLMRRVVYRILSSWLLFGAVAASDAAGRQDAARSSGTQLPAGAADLVARVVTLMGGPAVQGLERVRMDMMTQWQRIGYSAVPYTDRPSFESHVDLRDYTVPAWRNTRHVGGRFVVNIVRDTVATTAFGRGPQPLSVAYVDERDELFMYTPDRLMLLLLAAADLENAADTVIGGERHRQVRATLDTRRGPLPVTVAFHDGSGLPRLLRFRQAHVNDIGLVPYSDMHVEVWYSNWRTFGAVSIPAQWDIRRAGSAYKRMTVQAFTANPDIAADSFAVSDELRAAYVAERRPMHDVAVDSVTSPVRGLLQVHGFGFPAGALRMGNSWLLLESGYAPLNLQRGRAALSDHGADRVTAALLLAARTGNGAVVALVREGVPIITSPAAEPFLQVMLENAGIAAPPLTVIRAGQWLDVPGGRVRVEPLGLPDIPGSVIVHVPDLEWVYAPDVATPLDLRIVLDRAAALGWKVETVGTRWSFQTRWRGV